MFARSARVVALYGSGPIRLRARPRHAVSISHLISPGFLKIEWAAGRGQTAHFFPYEPLARRSEPLKCKNTIADATGCEQCLRLDVLLLPAIRRAGISLGLARRYRGAYGAHPSGVGTPTPRSITLVL